MTRSNRRQRWHPLLTVVILLILSLTAWAVDQARQKVSAVSDKDYYRHGLNYNADESAQGSTATGRWKIDVKLDGTLLKITLLDQNGAPVTGAKGEIVLLGSHPGAMQRIDYVLAEIDPGQYMVRLPAQLKGQIMAQLTLDKGETSLHRSLMLNF